jgi:hypothetical protein
MLSRSSIGSIVLAVTLTLASVSASAHDDAKYPDWKGQWLRVGGGQGAPWDPNKPPGLGQQAPLTPEYQAIYEANLKNQEAGGQGTDPGYKCVPSGMPRAMIAVQPMEIVITPETTYILLELFNTVRRVYTDGRDWPKQIEPTFAGYSIGRWLDEDGDGRYDTLVIETRGIKGPRVYDSSGTPLHEDNESIIKERIYSDKANPAILYNEVTAIDHALTRPWTVKRSYRIVRKEQPVWSEYYCSEDNHHITIGKENYYATDDGHLMPVRKGQPPPDLSYFDPPAK